MPFFHKGSMHRVRVESVDKPSSNVVPLFFHRPAGMGHNGHRQMTNLTGQPQRNLGKEVAVGKKKSAVPVLLPISMTTDDTRRLNALANSSEELFPRAAYFLAREMESATEVEDSTPLNGIIRMGPQVRYRDKTSGVKDVVLVYPHEPDIAPKHISVLMR